MALLAETVVEEWLARQGYFTIRGLKSGNDEIDLLATRNINGIRENLHIEVSVSINPVAYIARLSQKLQDEFEIKGSSNAKKRKPEQIKTAVNEWLHKKFFSSKKEKIRKELCDEANWNFMFVYGNIKDKKELEHILASKKVKLKPISEIILELKRDKFKYTTASATDLIDLLKLYE